MPKRTKELIMERDTAYGAKELQKAEPKRRRTKTKVSQQPVEFADSSSYKNLFYGALAVVVLFAIFVLGMRLFAPKGTITPEAAKTSIAVITLPQSTNINLSPNPTEEQRTAEVTKKPEESKRMSAVTPTTVPTVTVMPTHTETQKQIIQAQREYTVQQGDSLWTISEKEYNTGYNWTQIAQANHISNPDIINEGATIVIPTSTPSPIAQENPQTGNQTKGGLTIQNNSPNAITTSTYTVQHGDDLWNIAVRAYGDGYKWVDIARSNNLANPDLIHSGNVLSIPRG